MNKLEHLEEVAMISRRFQNGVDQLPNAVETLLQFIDLLILENEKEEYEHRRSTDQSHRFSIRLGRINRMLDEAGVAPEGNADERLARMLNRELPEYPL